MFKECFPVELILPIMTPKVTPRKINLYMLNLKQKKGGPDSELSVEYKENGKVNVHHAFFLAFYIVWICALENKVLGSILHQRASILFLRMGLFLFESTFPVGSASKNISIATWNAGHFSTLIHVTSSEPS